jgi:hypothetical protein
MMMAISAAPASQSFRQADHVQHGRSTNLGQAY